METCLLRNSMGDGLCAPLIRKEQCVVTPHLTILVG